MKKRLNRIFLFTGIFLGVILIFYLKPALEPIKIEERDFSSTQQENKKTSWKYQELKAAGFSTYIGASVKKLTDEFGEPVTIQESGFGYEVYKFQDVNGQLQFEANVENNKVETIKVLKSPDESVTPFTLGMTMQELTRYTTIFPNFSFDYNGKNISIELTEEDMNYRPLIAFDNGTFAILFFDQTKGNLFSIVYLDEKSLLTLLPYQVDGTDLPTYEMDQSADWKTINQQKIQNSILLLNQLREFDQLSTYQANGTLQTTTDKILTNFLVDPKSIVSKERSTILQKAFEEKGANATFTLNHDEMNQLFAKNNLEIGNGIFYHPVIDPMFTMFYLYSDPYYHVRFMHEGPEEVGISFSQENMLILLEEYHAPEESSESN
ncbi:MAG: CAP-associated domain-containing protein [Enterococcus sp.]